MSFPQKQTKSSFHCFKYIEFLKLAVIICSIGLFDRLYDIPNLIFHFSNSFYTLIVVEYFKEEYKTTSDFIASSVRVNPVVIRQILGQLKKAGLLEVHAGSGGVSLLKKPQNITLLDVFNAVEPFDGGAMFGFHKNPNLSCPVGKNIHNLLDDKLASIQSAMENELKKTTLSDLLNQVKLLNK